MKSDVLHRIGQYFIQTKNEIYLHFMDRYHGKIKVNHRNIFAPQ